MTPAIAIMAAPRPAPNVHTTLAGMLCASPAAAHTDILVSFDSVVEHRDARVLAEYKNIEARFLRDQEREQLVDVAPEHRARKNYARILRAVENRWQDVIVIEDDLIFSDHWYETLRDHAHRLPGVPLLGYERHVLADIEHVRMVPARDDAYASRLVAHEASHAMLCTLWPAALIRSAADALEASNDPADVTLDRFLRERSIQPLTLIPSVVDHRGDESLINPHDGVRRAPQFGGAP